MKPEEFQRLRRRIDRHNREIDRAKGALGQIKKQFREEFGCESLENAKAKLKKQRARQKQLEGQQEQLLEEFKEEWQEELGL